MMNKNFKEQINTDKEFLWGSIIKLQQRVEALEDNQYIPKRGLIVGRVYKIRDILERLLVYLELEIQYIHQAPARIELCPKAKEIDEEQEMLG